MAAGLNRGWFIERDQNPESPFAEGSDAARAKGLVLAEIADADFIDTIIKVKTFLDAFGGQVWLGAQRLRFNRRGQRVSHSEPGQYISTAYITKFTKDPVKGEPEEPEVTFKEIEGLYLSQLPEMSGNGHEEAAPEEVEAAAAQAEG